MDLVAITDHDTLDGALELLDHLPGAIVNETQRRNKKYVKWLAENLFQG